MTSSSPPSTINPVVDGGAADAGDELGISTTAWHTPQQCSHEVPGLRLHKSRVRPLPSLLPYPFLAYCFSLFVLHWPGAVLHHTHSSWCCSTAAVEPKLDSRTRDQQKRSADCHLRVTALLAWSSARITAMDAAAASRDGAPALPCGNAAAAAAVRAINPAHAQCTGAPPLASITAASRQVSRVGPQQQRCGGLVAQRPAHAGGMPASRVSGHQGMTSSVLLQPPVAIRACARAWRLPGKAAIPVQHEADAHPTC